MKYKYGIYARPKKSFVTFADSIFSSKFEQPQEGDILIEEGEGEKYIHVQDRYKVYDLNFLHNYKIVGGKLVPTTDADKRKEQGLEPEPDTPPEKKIEENTESINKLKEENTHLKDELKASSDLNQELSDYVLSLEERLTNIENKTKGEM